MHAAPTIVTAFYNLDRGNWQGTVNGRKIPSIIKRDENTYFERFKRLTKLKNRIIVFAQGIYEEKIRSYREDIVFYNIDDLFSTHKSLIETITNIQKNQAFIDFVDNPALPEYWSAEYVLINLLKSQFVLTAIKSDAEPQLDYAWIDFGYCRPEVFCPENSLWTFDCKHKINLFAIQDPDNTKPIFDIIKTNTVYFQGCHIVAPSNMWEAFNRLINESINELFNCSLVDDDQTLLLMSYKKQPHLFNVNMVDPKDWFVIFKDFNTIPHDAEDIKNHDLLLSSLNQKKKAHISSLWKKIRRRIT
jgi:protein YibB